MRARGGRSAFERKIDIFRDTEWVGPLPIFCFLIEHPEGAVPRRYRRYGKKFRSGLSSTVESLKEVIIRVAPLEEIGPRLQAMNLDPACDIKAVILTHFHHDHTGGLDHFPHTRIIAGRESYEASTGLKGKVVGGAIAPTLADMAQAGPG